MMEDEKNAELLCDVKNTLGGLQAPCSALHKGGVGGRGRPQPRGCPGRRHQVFFGFCIKQHSQN